MPPHKQLNMPRYAPNLIGNEYGRLLVIDRAENERSNHSRWVCQCKCGTIKEVSARHLLSGNTRSCGCYQQEMNIEKHTTHGETNTRLFAIWCGMKARCYCPTHSSYKRYGGRGITVCDEWLNSFESFRDWSLNNGYQPYLSIDRIENSGNYCPENCRWATAKEQANNRRNNKKLRIKGEIQYD